MKAAATAQALLGWHLTHPRCPRCGGPTRSRDAGWLRVCEADGSQHHPRTDPAVIMAVIDEADRILLARNTGWPQGRLSVLAGFVEPGERLVDAVAREVFEETGVLLAAHPDGRPVSEADRLRQPEFRRAGQHQGERPEHDQQRQPGAALPVSFDQARHVSGGDRPGSWMALSFRLPDPVPREHLAAARQAFADARVPVENLLPTDAVRQLCWDGTADGAGAMVLTASEEPGYFYPPTVLTDVPLEAQMVREVLDAIELDRGAPGDEQVRDRKHRLTHSGAPRRDRRAPRTRPESATPGS